MALYTNINTGYVISDNEMKTAHPNTIFPYPFEPIDGYVLLEETTPPYDPETQKLVYSENAYLINGKWSRNITVVSLTPEELYDLKKARVPYVVSRKQARRALVLSGLLNQVQTAINAIPDPTTRALAQVDWDDAQEFRRDDVTLQMIATALSLSEDDLDDLFILAGEQP